MIRAALKQKASRSIAHVRFWRVKTLARLAHERRQHGGKIEAVLWIIGLAVIAGAALVVGETAAPYSEDADTWAVLQTAIIAVGGALVGGAAIAASFILFAMQVNVERLPHGLFRRFSADKRLLAAIGATFAVALALSLMPAFVGSSYASYAIAVTLFGVAVVLRLFLWSYRRSLDLINPAEQLGIVVGDVSRDLKRWDRRAKWARPLMQPPDIPDIGAQDLARVAFFIANPHWSRKVFEGVTHTMSLARRAGEQGDVQASNNSLQALVAIHRHYVATKGGTFFSTNLFVENPLASDPVLTKTLEQLRQLIDASLSRRDEQQLEQALATLRVLSQVYLEIDYGQPYEYKSHAQLTAGYLESAVEAIAPHGLPDALMNGVREMGRVALSFLQSAQPEEAVGLIEKISTVGSAGVVRRDHRPVTLVAMEQLTAITTGLLQVQDHDIRYAASRVTERVFMLAQFFLDVPDSPLTATHNNYLAPYFSSTQQRSLRHQLGAFANALSALSPDDQTAKRLLANVSIWADGIHRPAKDLLLRAVEKRSHFTFDVIHWITGVAEALLAISNAPACEEPVRRDLQDRANWLLMTLSWLPKDRDSVAFLENFRVTETLFLSALDAEKRGSAAIAANMTMLLLRWGLSAGAHQIGWGILEQSIYALAALAIRRGQVDELKVNLTNSLVKADSLTQQMRNDVAQAIREKSDHVGMGSGMGAIEQALNSIDHEDAQTLLNEVADLLSIDANVQGPGEEGAGPAA